MLLQELVSEGEKKSKNFDSSISVSWWDTRGGRGEHFINPLSPKSDENQFSPKDINT